jgi:hypothetical protein
MTTPLALEQAPPLSVPLRFFLSGPPLGAAAGVLVAVRWDVVTESRWALESLAAVHLVTVGFMLQVMAGALLQFLPVAAGANVWRPRVTGAVAHIGFLGGGLLLVGGFLGLGGWCFRGAAFTFGVATLFYVAVVGGGLLRSSAIGPTLPALKLAVLGLLVTVALGVTLLTALGWSARVPVLEVLHAHVAWGVIGWSATLVVGVAYLVVPMFQLTPPYPTRLAFALPPGLFGAALAWTAGVLLAVRWLAWAGTALGALALVGFAVKTLQLQARRRRGVKDSTFYAWRVGMAALVLAVVAAVAVRALPEGAARIRLEYVVGVALFAGVFPAVISGMLYKIVPFLVWLHLQRVMTGAPTMQKVSPAAGPRWQLRVLGAALACLSLAAAWPVLAVAGGALFAAACLLLEWHVVQAARLYARLAAAAAQRPEAGARP